MLIVPKARTARDVWWVDVLLTQLETKLGLTKRIGLEVLIEEAEGLSNAAQIAGCERPARGDHLRRRRPLGLAASPGRRQLRPRSATTPATSGTTPVSRSWLRREALGIDAIDAPYPAYQDPEGYRRAAVHASLLGFDGKWAIHPDQIAIANEVFAPTAQEIEEARRSMETYRSSEAEGVGAIGRDGKLVDAAHMRLAANVLYKASLAEGRS